MAMQTTSLPIQAASSGQTQNLRAHAALPNDGVNFGATLQRQVEQRQLEQRQALAQPQPAMAPPPAAAPRPQAAAKPAANETRAPAREAAREPAKESAPAAGKAEGAQEAAAGETAATTQGEPRDEAANAADARVADSVVDMLALVASFNQVQPAPASPVPAEAAAAHADTLFDAAKGKPAAGAEPAMQLEGETLAAVGSQPQAKAEPGIDLRPLEQGKAADTAQPGVEARDFSATLRDTVAQAAAKEPAPAAEALRGVAAQAAALQSAQATGSVPTDRLSARVGTPAWDTQVGQKVIWMVGGADQSATLELNPPDLGPVQVVLNVSNDMASVTFSSQQLEVRQALENALPRLREMMSESGIALGNAQVNAGAEGRQGQDGNGSGRPGGGRGNHDKGGDSAVAEVMPRQRTGVIGGAGAVDTFA